MRNDLTLDMFLQEVFEKKASDLHISANAPVKLRIDGTLVNSQYTDFDLTAEESKELCYSKISDELIQEYEKTKEVDFSFQYEDKCRFRGNLFYQMETVTAAFRPIPQNIPKMEDLNLPEALKGLTDLPRGLILVTGPTGSGKSTTLASMIGHINRTRGEHIITIEDPIEFVHKSTTALVAQREVGKDTNSFLNALKYSLRQDPDIVLIGELRDLETVGAAITISETGHLVFATLHTNSAVETINRVIDVFPPHQQAQVRTQLSFVLQGVISQQLIPKIGGGRCLAQEIMIPNLAIRNLIREGKVHQVQSSMQIGQQKTGMITMDQKLISLYKDNLITKDDAIDYALNKDDIKKVLM